MKTTDYSIECRGDICAGDEIYFKEAVFAGSHRRPQFAGHREITAKVIRDSYGEQTQQHTFTLEVIGSDGVDAIEPGKKIRRKGRNVYRLVCGRKDRDAGKRQGALDEKHSRGDKARAQRERRREWSDPAAVFKN